MAAELAGGVLSEDFPAQLAGFGAGSLVAGYRLEAQVGTGGMAVVFRARDERLGRPVALKILAPALASDLKFRQRFMAESRAAAAVDDPHIIPIYEAGEADGVLFIAMRFVMGGDLLRVLEREGALPPGRAVAFISPVASALDAAHRAGLVHRDVKPANILVDARQGRPDHVYLSDFGVSKVAMSSVRLTGTGVFLGTPDYSAPEQIRGLAVDGRADQYALACVAYQLLTGSLPFGRDQGMAVLFAHLSEPPPALGAGLPGAADQVLARALAKAPEQRYGSCQDFADALREALGLAPYTSGGSPSAPGHPPFGIAPPPSGFPEWAAPGRAASPADLAAAATIDPAPGSGLVVAADGPAATASMTGSGHTRTEQHSRSDTPTAETAAQPATGPRTSAGSGRPPWDPGGSARDTHETADAASGLAPDPAPARAIRSHRGHRAQPARRRWPIVTTALVVLVAVIIGGSYIFWRWSQDQYYVAADSTGEVVIYRGISQSIVGISLSSPYQPTGIQLVQVPSNYQQALKNASSSGSLADVQETVANVRAAVQVCRQQYTALENWVFGEDRYQAALAAAKRLKKPVNSIPTPGPQPPSAAATCPSSSAFGIAASALAPTAQGQS